VQQIPIILCIDDEALGLKIRKTVLEHAGYQVLTAQSGEIGIALFTQETVDAVVLDYYMPGMDGGQVAAALRKERCSVPILLLSAYVDLPQEVTNLVDITMLKGEGPEELLLKMRELLTMKVAWPHKGARGESS
jgi:CheY-like chemotaxis protein